MAEPLIPQLQVVVHDGGYHITVTVENRGPSAIDPEIRQTTLLVDGEPSWNWGFALGNGAGTALETHLAPGERVTVERHLPASSLGGAGAHEFIAEIGGCRSLPVQVHIDE